MKIQLLSDLHIEFEEWDINCSQADIVIFAGDIDIGTKGVEWIRRQRIHCPVIYVLGNHEFYRHAHPRLIEKVSEAAIGTNIHVLENKAISINGVRFHGATLWTDFELFGTPKLTGSKCQEIMNDFKLIRRSPSYSRLRTIDVANIHKTTTEWLACSLEESQSTTNVVVTHHAPSPRSLPESTKDRAFAAAYASNLEELINTYKPDYWFHGHVHESLDYDIGDCRVICNPRGYNEGGRNLNFNPALLINIK